MVVLEINKVTNSDIESEEASWEVLGINVNATITTPKNVKAGDAIILIAGSGPTDRNWCSPLLKGTNGSGKLLAEKLAGEGFITIRYDKLAANKDIKAFLPKLVGKISMQSHLEELKGAVETINSRYKIRNMFALGNSEGCIHAVNYQLQAKKKPFDGLILTGAPGRSVGEVARNQLSDQLKNLSTMGGVVGILGKLGLLPKENQVMKYYDKAVADFINGKSMTMDKSLPKSIKRMLSSMETPTNLPFSRELWTYSLPEHVTDVVVPILVLIGKKDIQVGWDVDGKALENAMNKMMEVTFGYPEDANHLLKHEDKARDVLNVQYVSSHYNSPEAKLDEESSELISNWLKRYNKN